MKTMVLKRFGFLLLISAALFWTASASALLSEAGIEPLSIKGGARPIGMGTAYVGVCDDSNSLLYNPAGIARTKGLAVTIKDLGNFMAGQAYPTGYGTSFGLGFIRHSLPEVPSLGGSSEASASIVVLSLGAKLAFLSDMFRGSEFWKQVDVGLGIKYLLNQSFRDGGGIDRSAKGWDADFGVLYRPLSWLKTGVVFGNFMSKGEGGAGILDWDSGEDEEVKSNTVFGVGAKIIGDRTTPMYLENNEVILAGDVTMREDEPSTLFSLGAEWTYMRTYIGRIGLEQNAKDGDTVTGLNIGAGLRFGYWGLDVAHRTEYVNDEPGVYFSFTYWPREWFFVKKPVTVEELRRQEELSDIPEERERSPELVRILGPEERLVTDSDTVTIKGEVLKPGAKVYINGNLAQVDENNRFSVDLPISVGKNMVEIVTEYKGKKTLVKRRVLRKAKVVTPEEQKLDEKIAREIKPKETKIAAEESGLRPKEVKVSVAEEKIKELEDQPLSPEEKRALDLEKRKLEAQKKEIAAAKDRILKEKQRLQAEKSKIAAEKKEIARKKSAVENLATLGVIDITPGKVYEVEAAVTRGELASWIAKARGLAAPKLTKAPFPDVPKNHPQAPQIKAIVDIGVMNAYSDGTFRPDKPVSESEGAAIFKRLTGK